MKSFKEDLRKWSNEEIENQPGRLAARAGASQVCRVAASTA